MAIKIPKYNLPRVNESLSSQIDVFYEWAITKQREDGGADIDYSAPNKYADMLFSRYSQENPLLLSDLDVPEKTKKITRAMILTTLRKLERQARVEKRKLPRVSLETYLARINDLDIKQQTTLLNRFKKENPFLFSDILFYYSKIVPESMQAYITSYFIQVLATLEDQGNKDLLEKMVEEN